MALAQSMGSIKETKPKPLALFSCFVLITYGSEDSKEFRQRIGKVIGEKHVEEKNRGKRVFKKRRCEREA